MTQARLVSSQSPMGRDSAKKMKATMFVVDKVAQGIAKAIALNSPQPVNNPATKTLEGGLSKANDILQTMANHQVMSMAPQDIREHYFVKVSDLINVQARNRRLTLEVENEELSLHMRNIEKLKVTLKVCQLLRILTFHFMYQFFLIPSCCAYYCCIR